MLRDKFDGNEKHYGKCEFSLASFVFCGVLQNFGCAESELSTEAQGVRKDEPG